MSLEQIMLPPSKVIVRSGKRELNNNVSFGKIPVFLQLGTSIINVLF